MALINKKPSNQNFLAFTAMELLITVAILLILFGIFLYFGPFKQINKGYDATRKKDLEKLSIAFEDYNNDHYCYPTQEMINNCGSDDLSPYLDSIPCDPTLKVPYQLIVSPDSCPQDFTIFALLQNEDDPEGNNYGCYSIDSPESDADEQTDCTIYYGSGTPSTTPTPTDTPSPTPEYDIYYYCSGSGGDFGNCTELPAGKTCSPIYGDDPWCGNQCGDPANTCIPYSATPTPTDTPSPTPEYSIFYYCQGISNCSELPIGKTCYPLYGDDPWCNNECNDPINICIPY